SAVCVFSGQQACLFGGPLLVIIKALGIVKAAREYEKLLKRPVIPIFWIAGDDHDFEEVNHTFLLDRQTEAVKIEYATPPTLELPTADIRFEDIAELHRAKELLKETLGQTDFTPDLYDLLEHAYTAEDNFVTAFGKLMAALTKDTGLVLFNPCDKEVKELASPFFAEIINRQEEMHTIVNGRNGSILDSGYHVQVEKKDNASYLFYNREGRTAVMRDESKFKVGDCSYSVEELLDCLNQHPERFSPDVMTRPLFQSYLFPVLSQKGGPSEIAYLAQINPLFTLFNLAPPVHVARPTATVIESRYEKLLDEYKIDFVELTGDIEQVINRVMSSSFPEDLEKRFESLRSDVRHRFGEFSKESLKFDKSLEKFAAQIMGKIDFNLNAFEGKIFASHKKKLSDTRDRIYRLWNTLYTNRGLQERSLNINYFIARYGFGFVDFLYESLDVDEKAHQLIYQSEMSQS
ncbi:MAG: bacillithiol biosynthesis cysteine-adding enzyme BshC, partial [bacterium]|nr:bacillithiol biosynthesis cysteine-adding enzyme BshC [bacterium]